MMIQMGLSDEFIYAMAWTLLHSLWQISLVAVLLALLLKISGQARSSHRYYLALGSMAIVVIMALISFSAYYTKAESIDVGLTALVNNGISLNENLITGSSSGFLDSLESSFPLIFKLWLFGVVVFLLKILGGFIYLKQLVYKSINNPHLENLLLGLKNSFGIHRKVQILESAKIHTPMVMGYIKPVILFPIGLVNQLSPNEVECILAHELAHIKRHDFIVNLLQMIAEALFYYHPGIWFISQQINAERENCCDDLAITYSKSNLSYAKTLLKLQEMKSSVLTKPALAYSGHKSGFSKRILRILNQGTKGHFYKDKLLALILVFASLILGASNWKSESPVKANEPDIYFIEDCPQTEMDIKFYLDTIPERNSFHIRKLSDEKSLEMEMKNGEVSKLVIDGKEIPKEEYEKHKNVIRELSPSRDKDVITVLPDCDEELGNVFIFKSDAQKAINIDSLIQAEGREGMTKLRKIWREKDEKGRLREIVMDSLKDIIIDLDDHDFKIRAHRLELDSFIELFPDKMPEFGFFRDNNRDREIIIDLSRELKDTDRKIMRELERSHRDMERANRMQERNIFRKQRALEEMENNIFEHEFEDERNMVIDLRDMERELHFTRKPEKVSDHLMSQLLNDRLISEREKSKIELTGKHLKINGDKMPKNLWEKYKGIYEDYTGIELSKSSKLKFELNPEDIHKEKEHIIIKRLK